MTTEMQEFDKYKYYHMSVQSADVDVVFFKEKFEEFTGQKPKIFREDFCGTFSLCCEWVKMDPEHLAIGVDIDSEPTEYGKRHYLTELGQNQQARIKILNASVLESPLEKADISVAVNFSYMIFKERETLKNYFKICYESLNSKGIHMVDIFGGSDCYSANEEETEYEDEKFSYFWDQESYNPITSDALFHIHFKRQGEKKREKVFTYDWRLWSIKEIREIMEEVGFSKTVVFWEGTDEEDGSGNGEFYQTEEGEECEGWIAYVVGVKE